VRQQQGDASDRVFSRRPPSIESRHGKLRRALWAMQKRWRKVHDRRTLGRGIIGARANAGGEGAFGTLAGRIGTPGGTPARTQAEPLSRK